MDKHRIVPHDDWLLARKRFHAAEKAFTRARDDLSRQRRELPWERVEKDYIFEGAAGKESLAQLFAGRHQLIVYHFMFDPSWEAGCPHCSFWADNFNGIDVHLAHRDVTFLAISRASYAKLSAYRERMGWSFKWVSSFGSDFNYDYGVSFTPGQIEAGESIHNYGTQQPFGPETVGISVFYMDKFKKGDVFHTYSTYSRGVDMLNGAYHYLDLTPKGRDEAGYGAKPQAWVRRHDEYEASDVKDN